MIIHQQVFLDRMVLSDIHCYGSMVDNENGKNKNGKKRIEGQEKNRKGCLY